MLRKRFMDRVNSWAILPLKSLSTPRVFMWSDTIVINLVIK